MRYFYDTEFIEDSRTVDLISIGIVAEDGREYYAVNAEVNDDRAENSLGRRIGHHEWLMKNVVPSLPLRTPVSQYSGGSGAFMSPNLDMRDVRVKPTWVIANEVREFIAPTERWQDTELWAYYGAYDHVVLCQLFGTMIQLPKGMPMFTHELMQLWEAAGRPEKPEQTSGQHNALADARWNRDLYDSLVAARRPE